MALEPFVILRAVKSRFATDTGAGGLNTAGLSTIGARVHPYQAPPGATYPLIWQGHLSMQSDEGIGPDHCGLTAVWQIGLACKSQNFFDLETAAARVFTLLEGWNPTAESQELFWTLREYDARPVTVDGVEYREVYLRWDVEAQPA